MNYKGVSRRVDAKMVNIYTDYKKYDKGTIILDNDAYFDENVVANTFGELENNIIKNVDYAEVLDFNTGTIKTPRGIGALEDLSTGCKTILNYVYIQKNNIDNIKAIDASHCGSNALEVLFSTVETLGSPIDIVLRHKDELFRCKERDYVIDGKKKIKNLLYM